MADVCIRLDYRHYTLEIRVHDDREIVLSLDGVPRKRRRRDDLDCVYVWTNVELHWEEHHFIEGRWWPATGRLLVTANGIPIHDAPIRA